MFVTISAIGSVRVKTCHPSCWRVSLEIRALCGQGSKGSDMTWLWVLSVPSTPGIKVHISLLPRRADYHYIRHDRWIETLFFKESVSLQAIPMSKPCKANMILASTWLSVVNIIIVLPLFFFSLYLSLSLPLSLSLSLPPSLLPSLSLFGGTNIVIGQVFNYHILISLIMTSRTLAGGYHLDCSSRSVSVICSSTSFTPTHIWKVLCDDTA